MRYPLRLSALLVVVALVCAGFAPRVRSAVPPRPPAAQERIVTSEPATATIPGPLRSFLRIAGISQKASSEEVMPLLARNVFLIGYQGTGLGSRATEFLILLRRYVQQARELSDLAGKDGVIRVTGCGDAKQLLDILGYRVTADCGQSSTYVATAHHICVGTKRRPVEQAQAEIDGGRVQRIDARIELQQRRFLSIQRSCAGDQPLGQAGIDAPIAPVQRIGQRRSRGRRLQSHVEKLGLIGRHAGLDIAQRLAPGELGESHDAKQVRAAQRAHSGIASVSIDDPSETLPRHKLHDLREQCLACVHASLRVVQTRTHRKSTRQNSNRGHPLIVR